MQNLIYTYCLCLMHKNRAMQFFWTAMENRVRRGMPVTRLEFS